MEDIKTTILQLVQNERNELDAVLDDYFSKHPEKTNIEFVSANTTYFNISYTNKLGGIVYVQYALNELLRDCSGYSLVLNKWGDTPSSETLLVNMKNIEPLPGEFSALIKIINGLSSPVAGAYHFDNVQLKRIADFNRALALLHESDVAVVVDVNDNCVIRFVNAADIADVAYRTACFYGHTDDLFNFALIAVKLSCSHSVSYSLEIHLHNLDLCVRAGAYSSCSSLCEFFIISFKNSS